MRGCVMCIGVIWVQFNRALEFLLGAGPIPVVVEMNEAQGAVRIGQPIVDLDRLTRGGPRLRYSLTWRQSNRPLHVGVRQTCVGEGVVWIDADRLLKVLPGSG